MPKKSGAKRGAREVEEAQDATQVQDPQTTDQDPEMEKLMAEYKELSEWYERLTESIASAAAEQLVKHPGHPSKALWEVLGGDSLDAADIALIIAKAPSCGLEHCSSEADGKMVNAVGKCAHAGATPIMLAALAHRPEAVTLFIEAGANVNAADKHGQTALSIAVANGDLLSVEALVAHGAAVQASGSGKKAAGPIHLAVCDGKMDILKVLADKVTNFEEVDEAGRTPLLCAAAAGNLEMVNFFIGKGVDIGVKDLRGNNAMTLALSKENASVVRALYYADLERKKAAAK